VAVYQFSVLVDQVDSRPGAIFEISPCAEIVINRYGIFDIILGQVVLYVFDVAFVAKLRGMNGQSNESLIGIFFVPLLDIGFYVFAIPAAERPELYQYNLAFKVADCSWFAV